MRARQIRLWLTATMTLASLCACAPVDDTRAGDGGALVDAGGVSGEATGRPRNIILFVGDGMGREHIRAGRIYANGDTAPLSFEALPVVGEVRTNNYSGDTTDSAAAATAMATGRKVDNGVISVALPGDGSDVVTALELLAQDGKRTGLVTAATAITDATPAAFGAHQPSRDDVAEIGQDYLVGSRPNVLLGGASAGVTSTAATSTGYAVVEDEAELAALDVSEEAFVLGRFEPSAAPPLAVLTDFALSMLEQDPDGFFLLVEHEATDSFSHDNQLASVISAVLELRDAFDVARAWAEGRDDTLILLTADHETGGLSVIDDTPQAGEVPDHIWSTSGHTSADVALFADGPGSELLEGSYENTHIFEVVSGRSAD